MYDEKRNTLITNDISYAKYTDRISCISMKLIWTIFFETRIMIITYALFLETFSKTIIYF